MGVCAQSSPTLCDTMDYSLPDSPVHRMESSRQEYWSGLPFPFSTIVLYIFICPLNSTCALLIFAVIRGFFNSGS